MWFEGLTVRGFLVVMMLAVSAIGFIVVCTWPWLKEWYVTRRKKN